MLQLHLCECFDNLLSRMTKWMSQQRKRVLPGQLSLQIFKLWRSVLLRYWLIPKSNNVLSCLYTISLGGKLSPFITDVTRIPSLQGNLFVASL
ncbi:hypothetical protein V6N12_050262 [Hibiscus sabdariffa]|uniref:Uncharacterized protein n=1 Tax=Hibiscus sabdariffa TaxID=183260 RepID=A0ABR2GC21_9ROSI